MDIDSPSNICTVYDTFDFSKFILTHPESLPGGSFFTKLNINNDVLYLQTPKCISKQGVVCSSGKKSYIDLMFSSDDSKFIEFMENLEKSCVEKIHEKRNSWFTNDIDQNDIENAFTATLRPYKAGKYYLLRANIAPSKNLVKMPTCFVFDESENKLSLEDIKPENDLITVLEIQGIKFTSKSFQFEIIIRQALIMANKPVFQSCLIRKNISIPSTESQREQSTISVTSDQNENENENENVNENENEKIQPRIENNLEKIKKAKSKVVLNLEPNDDTDNDDTGNDDTENDDTSHKSKQNTHQNSDVDDNTNNLEKIDGRNVPLVTGLTGLTELTDLDLEIKNDNDSIKLKKPNDIYYEIYIAAKEKARTARKLAFDAYLEVKKIKKTYMLDDSDSDFSNSSGSDESDDSGESDHSDDSEKTDV
jgi:hypothetical protein